MKKILLPACIFICMSAGLRAQVLTFHNSGLVQIKLEKITPPLTAIKEVPPTKAELNSAKAERDNPSLEHHPPIVNANALPLGEDPALQKQYADANAPSSTSITMLSNWAGLSASVQPSDNCIAVGFNHVFQITNNNINSLIKIWDKAGNVLVNNLSTKSITGLGDGGDPNVLYDQQADRFVFVLLNSAYTKIIIAVSKTSDPTGSYYIYSFKPSGGLPDYPKIGVWGNSYFITTNSSSPSIWALNRTSILAGQPLGSVQKFTLSSFPKIGFQSASPVTQTGSIVPPADEPALVMRVADDAWSQSLSPDHLEQFQLSIDWVNTANSTITGPINLNTISYNSSLCGFGSFSCIPQPGSNTKLDPLSDILMDKVQYRNFSDHEAIVLSHVVNADGASTAGVRWYELRRVGNGSWTLYQQGTYSPNTDDRWMSSITINADGSIALGYNISSKTVYPGMRITGRAECDALNTMSAAETISKSGSKANSSTRYGDYNGIVTDPVDGSFWFTANYNPSSSWATNVVHFTINLCGSSKESQLTASAISNFSIAPVPATNQVKITFSNNGSDTQLPLRIFDLSGKIVLEQTVQISKGYNELTIDVQALKNGYYITKFFPSGGAAFVQRLVIQH